MPWLLSWAWAGNSPSRARTVMLLPEPLSPTSPSTSPARSSKWIPFSTGRSPCSVGNKTRRSRTCNTGGGVSTSRSPSLAVGLRSGSNEVGDPSRVNNGVTISAMEASSFGIQHLTQTVAEQVEGEHQQRQGQARHQRIPGRLQQIGLAGAEHAAPGGGRRWRTEAEKTKGRLQQHGARHAECQ